MKNSKIISLILALGLTLGSFSICKAATNFVSNSDKPFNVYSLAVPTSVSNFAKIKFQTVLESARQEPESYGLSKINIDNVYLGTGFNIFEVNNDSPKDQKIYYYPVMYNDRIKAIFTVGLDDNGKVCATLGTDFANQLQDVFEKYNDGSSFVLISSDNNIYAQNKSGSYPIFIYHKDKTINLEKTSYEKNIGSVENAFKINTKLDVKKKSDTVARDTTITYKSNILKNNSSPTTSSALTSIKTSSNSLVAIPLTLTSTWLQVPIVNQRDSNGVQRGMCWAASIASILNYTCSYNLNAMNVCNSMGIGYDAGVQTYQARAAMSSYGIVNARVVGALSEASIESYINNCVPIYMNSMTSLSVAHATVIRGYMVGGSSLQISIMNPATACYEAAYKYLNNSYYYYMGNDKFIWADSVVCY